MYSSMRQHLFQRALLISMHPFQYTVQYGFGRNYGISIDSNNLNIILDCVSESWHGSNVESRNTAKLMYSFHRYLDSTTYVGIYEKIPSSLPRILLPSRLPLSEAFSFDKTKAFILPRPLLQPLLLPSFPRGTIAQKLFKISFNSEIQTRRMNIWDAEETKSSKCASFFLLIIPKSTKTKR